LCCWDFSAQRLSNEGHLELMTSHDAAVVMGSAAATQEDSHSKTTQGGVAGILAVNPPPPHVIITFKKTHVQMLDDDVSGSDSTGDSPLPPVRRKKRPTRRYAAAGYSSGEDEQELFPTRSVRHKVVNFHESDSSSETDTGFKGQPPRVCVFSPPSLHTQKDLKEISFEFLIKCFQRWISLQSFQE
jgi:hypothetical protein